MKKKADGDDFALGHHRRAFRGLAKNERCGRLVEIFTKPVNKTENIANFIEADHMEMYLNI